MRKKNLISSRIYFLKKNII